MGEAPATPERLPDVDPISSERRGFEVAREEREKLEDDEGR
jgi:hypothetical protein